MHGIRDDDSQARLQSAVKSTQLPKVGEWTRIKMSHEKVDEKYFLSLSVGGRELGRSEVTDPLLQKLTDVTVIIGTRGTEGRFCQPGFIRRLVILEKQ